MTGWAATSAPELDAIVSAIGEPLLIASGFRAGGRRRWVRSFAPIRHVFELAAMKGATFIPRWGVSLDFVPHRKGATLAWHRTEKSARFDLVYDPVDFDPDWARNWGIRTLHGLAALRRDVERVFPAAVTRAVSWLDGARDLPSVFALADWLRTTERPGNRFSFDAFVQQPLAYAFLLARIGDGKAARVALDRWITSKEQEPLRERLTALLGD